MVSPLSVVMAAALLLPHWPLSDRLAVLMPHHTVLLGCCVCNHLLCSSLALGAHKHHLQNSAGRLHCHPVELHSGSRTLDHLCSVPTRYISCPQNAHFKTYNTPCMAVMYTCQYILTSCCPMFARHENVSWQSSQHRTGCTTQCLSTVDIGKQVSPTICTFTPGLTRDLRALLQAYPSLHLGGTAHNLQAQPGHTFTCAMMHAHKPHQLAQCRVEEMAQAKGDAVVMHRADSGQAHSIQMTRTPHPNQNQAKPPLVPDKRDRSHQPPCHHQLLHPTPPRPCSYYCCCCTGALSV